MLLALICVDIVNAGRTGTLERWSLGLLAVSCYVALALTNFAWLYPILTGVPISPATWNMEIWLPSWA
jgi:dolichyl-phosphate-mannose--protein O-mannosyl transferase